MNNAEVAKSFEELSDLLEIQGANPFRVRAYRNAARTLESSTHSVATLAEEGVAALQQLPGIGADLAEKILTLVTTGSLPQLEELREAVPSGVVQMLRVPGLGPKKAAVLFHELNIVTLEGLRAAAEAGEIAKLKGFGKKTEQTILAGISLAAEGDKRQLFAEARPVAEGLAADLAGVEGVERLEIAGSFRRRKETIGDLDFLVAADDSSPVMDRLAADPRVAEVLARGETKQTVRLANGLDLDLRVVPSSSFGAALQYFTGSKEHGIVLRRRAQERGLKLNEYGLFRGEEQVAGRTEEEIYQALGLPWIPPELRENRGEIERAVLGQIPELITVEDIRGDLHMHTTATDGKATIEEMALAARALGREYIAITDHSKRVSMARGLDADRLRAHWREIRSVREKIEGIQILCGIECDILEDATLDLPDDVLAEADWVIAVLHYGLKQPREMIHKRLLTAIQNRHVSMIGHLTGRLIGRRAGADLDIAEILKACADHGKLMEINASPDRLDLDDVHAAAAKDLGIPLVINTDAHSVRGLETMEYGVFQVRRAGLTKNDVANTRTWQEFQKLLPRKW